MAQPYQLVDQPAGQADHARVNCVDADRLDLGRVGAMPDAELLSTEAARQLIRWADRRAVANVVPGEVLAAWGMEDIRTE